MFKKKRPLHCHTKQTKLHKLLYVLILPRGEESICLVDDYIMMTALQRMGVTVKGQLTPKGKTSMWFEFCLLFFGW